MPKVNQHDKTVKDLKKEGITANDYGRAGDKCMEFLDSIPKTQRLSRSIKTDICIKVLDNQRKNETFSETSERLDLLFFPKKK